MDFKVTGTTEGITACQMDIKIKGLSYEILVKCTKTSKRWSFTYFRKIN